MQSETCGKLKEMEQNLKHYNSVNNKDKYYESSLLTN
jgi:hypothetical protein